MTIAQYLIDSTEFHRLKEVCKKNARSWKVNLVLCHTEYRFADGSGIRRYPSGFYELCETLKHQAPEFV